MRHTQLQLGNAWTGLPGRLPLTAQVGLTEACRHEEPASGRAGVQGSSQPGEWTEQGLTDRGDAAQ